MARSTAAMTQATLIGALALAACVGDRREQAPAARRQANHDGTARASAATPMSVHRVPFRVPDIGELHDPAMRISALRGRALLEHTRDSLPAFARSALECVSCHPMDGTRPNATPWVGVYARFPQFRSRSAAMNVLEDRINDCFRRSMNGLALPPNSGDMRDIVDYMAFLSTGVPVGAAVEGQGLPTLPLLFGDTARGARAYADNCARCHAADGGGTTLAPPTAGPKSYNIAAGMARVRTAASFIRYNMPADRPGTLTDQTAFDIAAYVDSRPRPDFPAKERDWPRGDAPADAPYRTLAAPAAGRRFPRVLARPRQ